jgi:hypothetical protein
MTGRSLGIAADTATVLWRAPPFTGHTARVLVAVVGWLEALMYEDVLPVVTDFARFPGLRWRHPLAAT